MLRRRSPGCRAWALTPRFQPCLCLHARPPLAPRASSAIGGVVSVALSLGFPRVAVSDLPALWSPDFPPAGGECPPAILCPPPARLAYHSPRRGSPGALRLGCVSEYPLNTLKWSDRYSVRGRLAIPNLASRSPAGDPATGGHLRPGRARARRDGRPLDAGAGAPPARRRPRLPGAARAHRHRAARALEPAARSGRGRLRRGARRGHALGLRPHRAGPLARADHRARSRAGGCARASSISTSTPARFTETSAQSILESLPFLLREDRAQGVDVTFEIRLTGAGGGVWSVHIHDGRCDVAPGLRRARRRPLHGRGARLVRRRARDRSTRAISTSAA